MRLILAAVTLAAWVSGAAAETLFLAGGASGQVAVFDIVEGRFREPLILGFPVLGLAADPVAGRLYALGAEAGIVVIDAASGSVVARLESEDSPLAVAPHPDGYQLYVVNGEGAPLTVVDAESGARAWSVELGLEPAGVAADPDGEWIAATAAGSGLIHIIDTETFQAVASLAVGQGAGAVRWSPPGPTGGRIWVASSIAGRVSVILDESFELAATLRFPLAGISAEAVQPVSIAHDGARAFVALGPSGRVAVIDAASYQVRQYIELETSADRLAVAAGRLFVLSSAAGKLTILDLESLKIVGAVDTAPGATDLAVLPSSP